VIFILFLWALPNGYSIVPLLACGFTAYGRAADRPEPGKIGSFVAVQRGPKPASFLPPQPKDLPRVIAPGDGT
jgi:hypothetical protein